MIKRSVTYITIVKNWTDNKRDLSDGSAHANNRERTFNNSFPRRKPQWVIHVLQWAEIPSVKGKRR